MQETRSRVQAQQRRDAARTSSRFERIILNSAYWLRAWWPVLIILALPVIILWRSVLGGSATTDSGALSLWLPWSANPVLGSGPPHNPLLFDEAQQVSPWFLFTRQQLLAGQIPLWDPNIAGGTPFLAAGQPAVFYPLTWLGVLLPYPYSMTVMTLVKWWAVGIGMYVFARQSLRLGQGAGLVAALSYMFSSFIVLWLVHPVGEAAILLPWLLWATERVIRQPSLWRVGVLALLTGLVGLSGHPEMSFHVTLGATLYALWLVATQRGQTWKARAQRLGRWIGGAALGICLAAVQYLPTATVLPEALTTTQRGQSYGAITVPLEGIGTWLVPNFWGNPVLVPLYFWGPRNYSEEVWYAGTVALVLAFVALLALRSRERRSEVLFFALLAVVFAMLLYRLPPVIWLTSLPLLDVDSWTRLGLLAIFGVSALAGCGFEEMLAWGKKALAPGGTPTAASRVAGWFGRRRWRVGLALAGLVALLPLLLWAAGRFYRPPRLEAAQVQFVLDWIRVAVLLVWGTLLLLFLRWRGWLNGRVVGGALLALILCDQLLFAAPLVPQTPISQVYPEIPAIARMQQTVGSARMTASNGILIPDTALAYGLHDLRAYETTTSRRYLNYMLALDPSLVQTNLACCEWLTCPSPVLLAVASVDFYATPADFDANTCQALASGQADAAGPLVPLWTEGGITLWRNTLARPRFYFASRVIASSDESQTLAELSDLSATGREAIIEGATAAASTPTPDTDTIRVLTDQPGQMTLRTQTAAARWLVIDEGYDAGWHADVDGASTPVRPANEMFQAVFVPAGTHTLHLVYRPLSFTVGALVSALALLAVLALLLGEWALRRLRLAGRFERRGARA